MTALGTGRTLAEIPHWARELTFIGESSMAQFDPEETLKQIWKLPACLGASVQETRCLRANRS